MTHPPLVEIRPRSWDDVLRISRGLGIYYIFRGQQDSSWGLAPSLERAAMRGGVYPSDVWDREAWVRREFQRRAHNYRSEMDRLSPIDQLALIQHYGGPTRLLDFTHSLYVAAFFALEFSTGDAAIWAVNLRMLEDAIADALGVPNEAGFFVLTHGKYDQVAEDVVLLRRQARLVLPVEPYRMHERMSIQQALFLLPGDLSVRFEDNLAASFGCSPADLHDPPLLSIDEFLRSPQNQPLTRVVLCRDIRNSTLDDLWQMNVNSATLFPGLDGFARSLHYHVRAVSSIESWLADDDPWRRA